LGICKLIMLINKLKSYLKKQHPEKVRPNIIIVLLDQFRTDALDCHPIFDKLKKKGVFFSKVITYAPYTLASCHATFTGMYGRKNGVDAYTKSDNYYKKECFSITDYLSKAGYYTSAYTFSSILMPSSGFKKLKIIPEDEEKDVLSNHLNEIKNCYSQKDPFFLYLHHGEIHHGIVRDVIKKYSIDDDDYFGEKNRKSNVDLYRAYTKSAGDYMEKIYQSIEKNDPEGNTLLLVMTDHGGSNGEKIGEKAYGTFTYDYSIKIWNYMIWPKKFKPNTVIDSQVRTIDILPTILDITKIPLSKKKKTPDGLSMLNLINGIKEDDRFAFCETGGVDGLYPSPDSPNVRCVTDGKWKLIQNVTSNQFELYNLHEDPSEENNLYGSEPNETERLALELTKFI